MFNTSKTRLLIAAAAAMLLCTATVRADGNDDLEQIIQNASKGQNAQTSAQVRDYAESNSNEISAITQGYRAYLSQVQAVADSGDVTTAQSATTTAQTSRSTATTGHGQKSGATGLQRASLQPSSGLVMSHLAGGLSLPAVAPVSSTAHATAAQLQQGAAVQAQLQARKRELMHNPLPWP